MAKTIARRQTERVEETAPVQPQQRVADLGERLCRTLSVARALAQAGRRLDLAGIDDGVGRLCAQTLDLPAAEGREMVPMLHDVLRQVDLLAAIVRTAPGPDAAM